MTDPRLHQRFIASRDPDAPRPPDLGWLIIPAIIVVAFAVAAGLAVVAFT
jgi:hypothetical protein